MSALRRWLAGRAAVVGIPYVWLAVFFLLPFLVVAKISVSEMETTTFKDIVAWKDGAIAFSLNFGNYLLLVQDSLYFSTFVSSLKYAAVTTLLCLTIGYPFAYFMARARATLQPALLMLVMLPFWTSFLLRVYAWIGLLKNNGAINNVLMALHVIDEPLVMMQTDFAVYVGIVYSYLPFMVLPLYTTLEKQDLSLLEAAADLGARPVTTFFRITLPLSVPGIIAGSLLVFIPAVGEYVIPSLLGRTDQLMIGRVLSDEFFANRDWPVASAVAICMLILLIAPITLYQHFQSRALEKRA